MSHRGALDRLLALPPDQCELTREQCKAPSPNCRCVSGVVLPSTCALAGDGPISEDALSEISREVAEIGMTRGEAVLLQVLSDLFPSPLGDLNRARRRARRRARYDYLVEYLRECVSLEGSGLEGGELSRALAEAYDRRASMLARFIASEEPRT